MRPSVTALLAAIRSSLRTRAELAAEIVALRHQLAVLQRAAPRRLRLSQADRLVWVVLSRVWSGWRDAVQIVQPATVVAWHRRLFAWHWRWRSTQRGPGRPPIADDIRALIRKMHRANPIWGRPTHTWRTPEVGHRDRRNHRREVSRSAPGVALADLAHLPADAPVAVCIDGFLHRPDGNLPGSVRP